MFTDLGVPKTLLVALPVGPTGPGATPGEHRHDLGRASPIPKEGQS